MTGGAVSACRGLQIEAGAFQRSVTAYDGAAQSLDHHGGVPPLTQLLRRLEAQDEGLPLTDH